MSHPISIHFPEAIILPCFFLFCRPPASFPFGNEKTSGGLDPIGSHDIPPKQKAWKMPRPMDPSRPWSRMTTPFRNWEASLQQFRTMDALLENAEKSDKKWLSTIDCHGRTWKTTGFLIVAWSQDQTKRNTESIYRCIWYVYYIYIYCLWTFAAAGWFKCRAQWNFCTS